MPKTFNNKTNQPFCQLC